ncbi:MAG: hypothetical protein ACI8WM_003475, partial [Burkholderiaceae bacterium]
MVLFHMFNSCRKIYDGSPGASGAGALRVSSAVVLGAAECATF